MDKPREVRPERTGWRDPGLSERHRSWGWDCPAVDLDLFLEFDNGVAAAIIEYKNEYADIVRQSHPTVRALCDLATRAGIPAILCRYGSDFSWWCPEPLNRHAHKIEALALAPMMVEREWVEFLFHLRGRKVPRELIESLRGDRG